MKCHRPDHAYARVVARIISFTPAAQGWRVFRLDVDGQPFDEPLVGWALCEEGLPKSDCECVIRFVAPMTPGEFNALHLVEESEEACIVPPGETASYDVKDRSWSTRPLGELDAFCGDG
jgi:hypothetical protein